MTAAFDRIAEELEAGELVCIFPGGQDHQHRRDERLPPGVEKIVRRTPVPVVPMALKGMWGSFFSRKGGAAMRRPFRRFWSRIELVIGEPVAPERSDGGGARRACRRARRFHVAGAENRDWRRPSEPMPVP